MLQSLEHREVSRVDIVESKQGIYLVIRQIRLSTIFERSVPRNSNEQKLH